MSVIIEGMALPPSCRGCVMYDTMSCRILRRDVYRHAAITKDRPEDCPLHPVPEWISVEERLPEAYRCVLVICGFKTDKHYYSLMSSAHMDKIGTWVIHRPGFKKWAVTHWMPLPEPPEGGDGDG